MAPPPPELMEELTEEILLRFPPDNPVSLVRAAAVCKLWRRLICSAAFHRRFLEFHQTIPLLCVLCNYSWNNVRMLQMPMAYFVPTTSFRPACAAAGAGQDQSKFVWRAIDARHDRVLFCRSNPSFHGQDVLSVWDPFTDEQHELPGAPSFLTTQYSSYKHGFWNVAVACTVAAAGGPGGSCDHLDSHRGPFMVVLMHLKTQYMYLSVYSSEAMAWSKVTVSKRPIPDYFGVFNFKPAPGVLVRSTFYFLVHFNAEIVGYNMAKRKVSTVRLPDRFHHLKGSIVLMTDDDGGLGFVVNVKNKLELWSRMMDGADGDADFVLTKVIDLQKVLPSGALIKNSTQVNGFADGGAHRVLFIRVFDGLYTIEINSGQVMKLDNCYGNMDVVPYISFCTPTSRIQNVSPGTRNLIKAGSASAASIWLVQ